MPPTIRDISRECGFSPGTVSRALAKSPLVKAPTRAHILAVAQKLGWEPSASCSAYLAHRRSTKQPRYHATLAYVVSFPDRELYVDYHKCVYKGGRERAEENGYSLELLWLLDFDFDMAQFAKLLRNRGIPGFVLNGGELPSEKFANFDWNSFAVASWGFSITQPLLHQSAYHHMQGVRMIIARLRELGYHRIGMVVSETADHFADNNLLSAFCYLERHHLPGEWVKLYPLESWHSTQAERKKIQAWLLQHRPEVVIGEKICWDAISELGWKVPDDIAYVSPHWSAVWPQIAGVDNLPEVIGANAVDLVIDQVAQNERGIPLHPKLVLNEGLWRDGPTVPPNSMRNAR